MADPLTLPTFFDDRTGEVRVLGTIPPTMKAIADLAATGMRSQRLVPQSDWQEFELDPGPIKIKDQDGKGACNGHACATSLEWARRLSGMSHVDLSAWYAYAIMCGGIDRGSMIEDALALARDRGVCPEPMVPYGLINPNRIPAEAHEAAKGYRIELGSIIANFDELMSATQLREPGDFSLCVGGNFNNLDADGVPGYSGGAGNHAVTFGLGAKRLRNGEWGIKWQNSWSTKWGLDGYAWVTRKFIDKQRYFSAYTVLAAVDLPGDPLNPPVAK